MRLPDAREFTFGNTYGWLERMGAVNAGGFATLSKNPDRFPSGFAPSVVSHGDGCHIVDMDNNKFLDTIGALGAVLFGYRWPSTTEAIIDAAKTIGGPAFSNGHYLEIEVAEMLCGEILACDKVRFCKNGADATQAAVRIARETTQKKHILACGYHGHHDWYICSTDKDGGVLSEIKPYTTQFEWGNYEEFDALLGKTAHNLAGVILEIPPGNFGDPNQDAEIADFLEYVQEQCHKYYGVFILDEIVTGFRYGLGGAGAMYGCTPDLICFGKAMANGMPIAVIGGDSYLMDEFIGGNVFMSTTNGGDVYALAAAKACINDLGERKYVDQLWKTGWHIGQGIQDTIALFDLPVDLIGNGVRMVMKWRNTDAATGDELKTLWLQETAKMGVLFGGPIFPTVMMTQEDVKSVVDAAHFAGESMRMAINKGNVKGYLECNVIEDVFSKRYRPFDPASGLSGV
jgi:glutamate-1-semialdehyde aminotransferase